MQNYITGDNIALFILLAVAAAWVVTQLLNAKNAIAREAKERSKPMEELQATIERHERRIEKLESRTSEQGEELKLVLKGLMALLHHEVDGNNTSKLTECYAAIERFLTDK